MTDNSFRTWVIGAGSLAGAVLAILSLWIFLGGPSLATKEWVDDRIAPLQSASSRQLRIERRVVLNELFLWESNATRDANILFNIDRLRREVTELDQQIASHRN